MALVISIVLNLRLLFSKQKSNGDDKTRYHVDKLMKMGKVQSLVMTYKDG